MDIIKPQSVFLSFIIVSSIFGCVSTSLETGNTVFISGHDGRGKVLDTIPKLNKSDFKLVCKEGNHDGQISLSITTKVQLNSRGKLVWFSTLENYPYESCLKANLDPEYLSLILQHEELHAKLTEVARRKFNFKLDSINRCNKVPISFMRARRICNIAFIQVEAEDEAINKLYDQETYANENQVIRAKQNLWIDRIDSLFNAYSVWNKKEWED